MAAGLAPRVREVVAFDLFPAMLEGARENLSRFGIGNLELREADLGGLPLSEGS